MIHFILQLLAGTAMVLGTLGALRQANLKRLLASGMVVHAGYVLGGASLSAGGTATAGWQIPVFLFVSGSSHACRCFHCKFCCMQGFRTGGTQCACGFILPCTAGCSGPLDSNRFTLRPSFIRRMDREMDAADGCCAIR